MGVKDRLKRVAQGIPKCHYCKSPGEWRANGVPVCSEHKKVMQEINN